MKKNFQTVVTQVGIGNKNFGVGLIDNNRMIKNFSGLSESDARNAEKFVGGIYAVILEENILLPIDETAHVVKISDGNFYTCLNFLNYAQDENDEFFFSSEPFETRIAADIAAASANYMLNWLAGDDSDVPF